MESVRPINKVLLLSANTGQGHNSAAGAIAELCRERGITADVVDGLAFASRSVSNFLSKGHRLMYRRGPALFQVGWGYSERHPGLFEHGSLIFKILAKGTDRLRDAIVEGGYDTVISTHAFTGMLLTETLRKYPLSVRSAFVSTDYTDYPCTHMCRLGLNLIPDESVIPSYTRWDISREQMVIGSIPVHRTFLRPLPRAEAKRSLGLREDGRHLLVMGGSMGCGPMKRIVALLAKDMPPDAEITVICGTNKSLRRRLTKRYALFDRVHIIGYTDRIADYMAASELYLTKPGGISTTEAATMALPMVLVNAVAGCETYNLRYMTELGGAVTARKPAELAALCLSLLEDSATRACMKKSLLDKSFTDGAAVLLDALVSPILQPQTT